MSYWLDVLLCGLVTLGELIGVMLLAVLTQIIFYKIFRINLYKKIIKGLNKLEKYIEEVN